MSRNDPRSDWSLDCKVYVGDLGHGCAKQELEEKFSKYGTLRNVWVARKPPGFAFVEFEDPPDAEDAVRGLNKTKINGRRVRVEMSSGQSRWGSRGQSRSGRDDRRDDRDYYRGGSSSGGSSRRRHERAATSRNSSPPAAGLAISSQQQLSSNITTTTTTTTSISFFITSTTISIINFSNRSALRAHAAAVAVTHPEEEVAADKGKKPVFIIPRLPPDGLRPAKQLLI
ncbi:serine/arginine-rich splicing factor 1 [Elysia marginata]|uniref:Serine/arginine-rich splicing factor 1 n=1 Tax=Elysia marginata TaxID=1093978 RepID=A0AAV4JWD7_9GAST|nr:serine/arginine-rich splicing factor 1 [Elysia marginata]